MKKLTNTDIQNGLSLIHIALQNWNICKSTWSNRNGAQINIVALKEDIICISTVLPTGALNSDAIFKLLTQANDLAVQASIGNEKKLLCIKRDLLKLRKILKLIHEKK